MAPSVFGLQGTGFYVGPTQVAGSAEPNLPTEDPSRNTTLNGTSTFLMATATAATVISGCGEREQAPQATPEQLTLGDSCNDTLQHTRDYYQHGAMPAALVVGLFLGVTGTLGIQNRRAIWNGIVHTVERVSDYARARYEAWKHRNDPPPENPSAPDGPEK